ncbi:hypothetical protein FGB62_95g098 [Gracilaria domingensis]|nr:hypothetical protein FGB62_95g098 [Gracilaria domingensis]
MLSVTVHSARDLRNADEAEGGQSDPFVLICFDNKTDQELGRTPTVENSDSPTWDYEMEVDVAKHVQTAVDEGLEEPKMITFCVYDSDETESEPLGVAGVSFSELVKKGKIKEQELPVFLGEGSITVSLGLKKVKKNSMLTDDGMLKIAGGVAGVAALGLAGGYLYNRYQKKKERAEEMDGEEVVFGEDGVKSTGLSYGYNEDSDDDDEEGKGQIKRWWQMEDENDDDDDDNRWGDAEY